MKEIVPGQWWQRGLALLFGAAAAWLFVTRNVNHVPRTILWIATVLFIMSALLAVPPLYRRWIAFAEWLSVWMTRLMFSVIYLLAVPFVRVLYALSRRGKNTTTGMSLWIPKRAHDRSLDDLERMG